MAICGLVALFSNALPAACRSRPAPCIMLHAESAAKTAAPITIVSLFIIPPHDGDRRETRGSLRGVVRRRDCGSIAREHRSFTHLRPAAAAPYPLGRTSVMHSRHMW